MRGSGRIYKQATSVYWWAQYSVGGRRVRESTGTANRQAALRWLAARVAAGRAPASGATLAELANLSERDYARRGRRSTTRLMQAWKHLHAQLGPREPVQRITTARVLGYMDARREAGAAAATANYEVAVLKRAFNLAKAAGLVHHVDVAWPTLTVTNRRVGFFEARELELVLAHLDADVADLVRFLAFTGWRKSEAQGITWDQVDVDREVLRIEVTKNNEPRTLPWGAWDDLAAVMYRCLNRTRGVGRVFAQGSFRKRWLSACKAAGVAGRLVHDLRRTAARDMSRAGLPEVLIMQLAGWRSRSVFTRYRIVSEADLSEGLAKRGRS